jgi:hypothetical protein
MVTQEAEKKPGKKSLDPGKESDLPKGKVRCYISKQICDEKDTIELDYNGAIVRIHRKYARA